MVQIYQCIFFSFVFAFFLFVCLFFVNWDSLDLLKGMKLQEKEAQKG